MSIADNVARVRERIYEAAAHEGLDGSRVLLVAASKQNSAERVREAVAAGVDACGENRVQELTEKLEAHAYDGAPVHLIGHLQRNKIKQVIGQVELIQSADSLELLRLIELRAAALGITQELLVEVNLFRVESRTGLLPEALDEFLSAAGEFEHIRLRGLMAIAPASEVYVENRRNFAKIRELFVDIGTKKYNNIAMDFLSMGMSADFEAAVAEGANMVRVGSAIFGARLYPQK